MSVEMLARVVSPVSGVSGVQVKKERCVSSLTIIIIIKQEQQEWKQIIIIIIKTDDNYRSGIGIKHLDHNSKRNYKRNHVYKTITLIN